ncbi:MAG: ABC transporter ATP-binding protein [Gammaproteobacteria bacterium]
MSAIATARGLTRTFGTTKALDNVDFTIERGRIVGLIGPNGAGKTTALRALLGLSDYDGELDVLGCDPKRQRAKLMEKACFIADISVLPRWLKVRNAVDFMANTHPSFSRDKAMAFLDRTSVRIDHKVKQLSKGMVAQLHLALVMAIDAEFLVLDEPTLGLDLLYRKKFYETLLTDYFDDNRTILVTTHQFEEVERILTDVMFLQEGRIVLDASVEDLGQRYVEVLVNPDRASEARALGALYERQVFGKTLFLYEGRERAELEQFGELHTPSVSDIFVAKMTDPQELAA